MKKENIESFIDALKLINKYKTAKSFVADDEDILKVYDTLKEKIEKSGQKLDPIYGKARQIFDNFKDFDFDHIKKHIVYPDGFEDIKRSFEEFIKETKSDKEEDVKPEKEKNNDKNLEPFLSEYNETENCGVVNHYYELPGFRDRDLDANIDNNVLTITGTNQFNKFIKIKLDLSRNILINVEIQYGILSIQLEESVTKKVKINTRYDEI